MKKEIFHRSNCVGVITIKVIASEGDVEAITERKIGFCSGFLQKEELAELKKAAIEYYRNLAKVNTKDFFITPTSKVRFRCNVTMLECDTIYKK